MPKWCFYGIFVDFSFFAVHLCRSGKPSVTARPMNGTSRHQRRANRKNAVSAGPNEFEPTDTAYFLCCGLPGFTLPAWLPFFFRWFLFPIRIFFGDFSLNMPLFPFTSIFAPFSEPHQVVILVLGAKVIPGLDGKARSSLLFPRKISSPAGSIFSGKPCIS